MSVSTLCLNSFTGSFLLVMATFFQKWLVLSSLGLVIVVDGWYTNVYFDAQIREALIHVCKLLCINGPKCLLIYWFMQEPLCIYFISLPIILDNYFLHLLMYLFIYVLFMYKLHEVFLFLALYSFLHIMMYLAIYLLMCLFIYTTRCTAWLRHHTSCTVVSWPRSGLHPKSAGVVQWL